MHAPARTLETLAVIRWYATAVFFLIMVGGVVLLPSRRVAERTPPPQPIAQVVA